MTTGGNLGRPILRIRHTAGVDNVALTRFVIWESRSGCSGWQRRGPTAAREGLARRKGWFSRLVGRPKNSGGFGGWIARRRSAGELPSSSRLEITKISARSALLDKVAW